MTTQRPDTILVIMTDQQRADFSAREGFGVDSTPRLDALARQGCWFDRAYTAAPVCVPARISMLTGRFPSVHGVRENHDFASPRHAGDLFDVATEAGYRTALIGKNHSHVTAARVDRFSTFGHLGRTPPSDPETEEGRFDAWLHELGAMTSREATPHPVEVQNPARIVTEAIDWLSAEPNEPALAWLSMPEPHVPYQVPEPYFTDFGPDVVPEPATDSEVLDNAGLPWQWVRRLGRALNEADRETLLRARANYVGMMRLIDDQIGRLVDHLTDTGRLQSTLIVFVADHGDFAGDYGLLRKGPGLPEVLTRVPMFFSGAGVHRDTGLVGPSRAHVSIVDILPTICELAGWTVPDGVQGRSLVPLLQGREQPPGEFDCAYAEQGVGGLPHPGGSAVDDYIASDAESLVGDSGQTPPPGADVPVATLCDVTQDGALRMVRSGRWKLVMQVTGETELFDLSQDPYELHDRHRDPECAEAYTSMLEHLAKWLIRVADPLPIPEGGYARSTHPRNYHWHEGVE